MNRPFFSLARYSLKFSTATIGDAERTLIGFDLGAGSISKGITPNVKKKLTGRSKDNGLYDENGNYYSNGSLIFVIMGSRVTYASVGDEVFFELCKSGAPEEISAAIKNGADINALDSDGWTPLMFAVYRSDPEVISVLLNAGADIDATVLNTAIYGINSLEVPIISLLLEHGANINEREEGASTFLMEAVRHGNPELISFLVKAGADVNARDKYGNTALMKAADSPRTDNKSSVTSILLQAGADVNARNVRGQTALMNAALSPKPDMIRVLLDGGADPNVQDDDGKRAIDRVDLFYIRQNFAAYKETYQILDEVTK
jgi:ankyrin repeat protein